MRDYWLGVVTGGALAGVATVWVWFWFFRRRVTDQEAAAKRLSEAKKAQYEADMRWRRRAAEWDAFAGQALTAVDDAHHDTLIDLLPSNSALQPRSERSDQPG